MRAPVLFVRLEICTELNFSHPRLFLFAMTGKSLYIKRLYERLKHSARSSVLKCIRLINPVIDEDVVLQSLLTTPTRTEPTLFHFDVTSSVSFNPADEGLRTSVMIAEGAHVTRPRCALNLM